jgi:type IV pilus assembly protein PilB
MAGVLRGQPPTRRLGDLLVADGLITPAQLEQALGLQKSTGDRLGALLVRLKFLGEDQLVLALSRQYGVPALALSPLDLDADALRLVPVTIARRHELLPVRRAGDALTVAVSDPTNLAALDDVAFVTGLAVRPVLASPAAIRKAIEQAYAPRGGAIAGVLAEVAEGALDTDGSAPDPRGRDAGLAGRDAGPAGRDADEAPVVRLVNMILAEAIQGGASDIHWEPYETVFRVRFRIDGVLQEVLTPPKRVEAAILSRLKIMASLDIAERRLPQDGRMRLRVDGRDVDFRVSTVPTIHGEKAVLRILDREALQLDLASLGFDARHREQFQQAIRQPHGMVLITGPTGSGKTTTLYSAMHTINSLDINIMTVEDPVEYSLRGVNQVHVDEAIGRTFATALRAFLRQDPDVILVGETRDLETAQISVRAALTGHLVLSTLHTNDCPSTVARLIDMGVPAFLVAASLRLVVAQRLARRVCPACRVPRDTDEADLVPFGHVPGGTGRCTLYRGTGCEACNFTGMKGRMALYELMPMTDELREQILKGASAAELRTTACAQGMRTLRQAGLARTLEGVMTIDEVLRVT